MFLLSYIIVLVKNQLGVDYNEIEFKRLVKEELTIRQYSENVINEWLNNI